MGSLEQFEQCCSVAMLVLATLLLLAATLHHAPAVAEKSDVEAAEPRDDYEAAADIEMSDKTIRTKDPLAKLCKKCPKLKNQKRAKNNEKKKSKHAKKNKSPLKLPKPVFAHHQLPQVPQSASTKDTVQLGPLGTFLKEIIQANTFIDA